MTVDIEKVKNFMKEFRDNKDINEFYVALLITDRLDTTPEEVTEDLVREVYKIYDRYETIYHPFINDGMDELL